MDQQKIMNCPRCSKLLASVKMRKLNHPSGAVLDVCDKCEGMWLDGPEVKLLYGFSTKKQKAKKWCNNFKTKLNNTILAKHNN